MPRPKGSKNKPRAVKETVKKEEQTSFVVMNGGQEVRTYSVEVHGKDAGKLAQQFCKKFNYKIK